MIKQIHITQVKVGMHLHKLGDDWMDHPFWRRSFPIRSPELLKIVQSGIEFLWIDTDKGLDADVPNAQLPIAEPEVDYVDMPVLPPATEPMPLATGDTQEIDLHRVNELCLNAGSAVTRLMTEARLGRAMRTAECVKVVEEIVDHVMDNAAAMILVVRLKNHDEDAYMHSVAVCALMVALARRLGFTRHQMCQAGMAGLLHDVGKALIPAELLHKAGKLTPDEYRLVQTHCQRGHALLSQSATPCAMALDVTLNHHERMDGSGYPNGLQGDQISLFAKMGAICDVYDALTSPRPHRPRLDPASAMRVMASRPNQFDPKVFQAFVRTIGIYPIGTVVKLESQQLAVVSGHDGDNLLKPKVKVFYSLCKQEPVEPWLLSLNSAQCTDRIVGIEPAGEMHLLAMEMM